MSIDIVDVGSFRHRLGLGGDDDKIMMLEGFGGFGAFDPKRPAKEDGKQLLKQPERLTDGPHFWLGPFLLPADHEADSLEIHVPISKMKKSEDYKQFGNWAVNQVTHLSKKKFGYCGWTKKDGAKWGNGTSALPGGGCDLFPSLDDRPHRSIAGVQVPANDVWAKQLITGKTPIAKFDHPGRNNESWAVYLTISGEGDDKQYPRPHFLFTFKKAKPGFWGKLWGWLKKIVTWYIKTLVDFWKSVIEGLLKYACQLATPILKELENAAKDKVLVKPAISAAITAKTGMDGEQIASIIQGGTSAGYKMLGETIIDKFCGDKAPTSPPLKTEEEEPDVSPWLIAGGVAGSLAVVAYLVWA